MRGQAICGPTLRLIVEFLRSGGIGALVSVLLPSMSEKKVLLPSAAHPITVTEHAGRVRVQFDGKVIAETDHALTLQEASYPPVQYIPLADVDASVLERTDHSTYCPFKGDAAYYSLRGREATVDNAVWTYEAPYEAVGSIKGHVAFYPTKVDVVTEHSP